MVGGKKGGLGAIMHIQNKGFDLNFYKPCHLAAIICTSGRQFFTRVG